MKRIITTISALLVAFGLSAQTFTYTTAQFTDAGNPGGINTDSDFSTSGWDAITTGSASANAWSSNVAIPFPFDFYGIQVTHLKASLNGVVTFDTLAVALPGANGNLPAVGLPDNSIAGMWDEFTSSPPIGSNDVVYTKVFGTAPNRQFWVRYHSFEIGNPSISFHYFAMVLEETTNKIYVVDMYSTSSGALSSTVGVQLDGTTAVQFGNDQIDKAGNGSSNSDNDYWEFTPLLLVNDDAGVLSLENPTNPATAGMNAFDVTIKNFGINNIASATVNWELNGTAQTAASFNGTLAPGDTSANIALGMGNLTTGLNTFKAWTSSPNGQTDGNPANDTLEAILCEALSGTFSVGPAAGNDFATINDAVNALSICGVGGPVIFNLDSGTYAETVIIPPINGASATNTITFDGGDFNDVTILNDSVAFQACVQLLGADHIELRNITFENKRTDDAWGIHLTDTADFNLIESCRFIMSDAQTFDINAILASASIGNDFAEGNNANNNEIALCQFFGSAIPVHLEGPSGGYNVGNFINRCQMEGFTSQAIFADQQDFLSVRGNIIQNVPAGNTSADGIYTFDQLNFDFQNNYIQVPDFGIYVSDGNFDDPPTQRGVIANNSIISDADDGIYLDDVEQTNIYFNTSRGESAIRVNDLDSVDIQNNIFASVGGFVFESFDNLTGTNNVVNYNGYYALPGNTNFVDEGINLYADLTAWQTGSADLNQNSIEGNPFFEDPSDVTAQRPQAPTYNNIGNGTLGIPFDITLAVRGANPDIGAFEFTPKQNDLGVSAVVEPFGGCGDSSTAVIVSVTNFGALNQIDPTAEAVITFPDASTATISGTLTGTIGFGESLTDTIGTFISAIGGTFGIQAYSQLGGDEDASNDTNTVSVTLAPTVPTNVASSPATLCAGDSAVLVALDEQPSDPVWYDAPTGGNVVAEGDTFVTGPLTTDTTFYVGIGERPAFLETDPNDNNGCGAGNMFDIVASADIVIDSFAVNLAGIDLNAAVFYIPNGTFVGNETNAAAWTPLDTTVANAPLANGLTTLPIDTPLVISAGDTFAIYIQYDARYVNISGLTSVSNAELELIAGAGHCSPFSPINNRQFSGRVYYRIPPCTDDRRAVPVTLTPPPTAGFTATSNELDITVTDASTGADSVKYDYGDGSMLTANATYTYAAPDTYVVCQIAYGICGTDTICDTLVITCAPASAGLSVASTELDVTVTDNSSGADSVKYDYGDGSALTANATYTYAAPDTYTVCQIAYSVCGNDTACEEVIVTCTGATAGFSVNQSGFQVDVTSSATNADSVRYDYGEGQGFTNATSYTYSVTGMYTITQVAYNDPCGNDTTTETVDITTSLEDLIGVETLSIAPNPSSGNFTLEIEASKSLTMQVKVTSVTGQTVLDLRNETVYGSYRRNLDLSNMSNGIYLLTLESNGARLTKRLVVRK